MDFFYSPSRDAFYPEEFKKEYTSSGTWPTDLIKVPVEIFIEFSNQKEGFVRKFSNNRLGWGHTEVSIEDTVCQERFWRDFELSVADIEIYKVQDSDQKATGSVSDWRNYRKALRSWPEDSNFPDKQFRPKAPNA